MLAEIVASKFPPGVALPEGVRVLCDYLDTHGYPLSGCFEISRIGREDVESWFPDDEAMQQQFAVFGRGSTGSTYALWLRDTQDASAAPVVVLGSEGEFLVLATDCREFCRLLGCGYDELEWDKLTEPGKKWNETQPLRDWLAEKMSLDFPATGEAIVAAAKAKHPDFAQYVTAWQNAHR